MSLQDQLKELFLLDKQVRGLRTRLDAATRRTELQKNKRDQLKQKNAELADQLKQSQAQANSLESQAKEKDQQITRHREQMNAVHSNKEYSALLVEVSTLKNDKGKLEDQALEQMTEVDAIKQQQGDLQDKIQQQEKLVRQAQDEVDAARAEVGDKLDEVTADRDRAAAEVPEDVLSAFDRLAEAYDGQAMAEVEEQDRRRMEYTCGGCYISLPVEHVNSLMLKPNEVVTCPNCHRILYIAEDLKSALKPQ